MHHRFEIQLIVNAILADSAHACRGDYDRDVVRQHLRRYLLRYHRENGVLPSGRHYLGMTRPLHLEIGMVDFDRVRARIIAEPPAAGAEA